MDSKAISKNIQNVIKIIDIPEIDMDGKYKIVEEKVIKYIERIIRSSYEYRDYIKYLKTTLDINSCTFYEGYSISNGLSVEIHHSPFTLFQYVETVCRKHFDLNKGYFDALEVAEEVTKLHFQFLVGLVPLNPTAHKLVHSGNLKIHPDLVLGGWEVFLEEYRKWLPESIDNDLIELEALRKNPSDEIPRILKKKELRIESTFQTFDNKFLTSMIDEKIKKIGIIDD